MFFTQKHIIKDKKILYLHKEIKSTGNGEKQSKYKICYCFIFTFLSFILKDNILSKAKIGTTYGIYNICRDKICDNKHTKDGQNRSIYS